MSRAPRSSRSANEALLISIPSRESLPLARVITVKAVHPSSPANRLCVSRTKLVIFLTSLKRLYKSGTLQTGLEALIGTARCALRGSVKEWSSRSAREPLSSRHEEFTVELAYCFTCNAPQTSRKKHECNGKTRSLFTCFEKAEDCSRRTLNESFVCLSVNRIRGPESTNAVTDVAASF